MFWKIGRYYVGLLGLLLGLNACVTEDLREPASGGSGYLRLELGSVATELSSVAQTKATTIPSTDVPKDTDFTIDIQKNGTSVDGFPKGYGELGATTLALPIGTYTVSASCGENALAQTTPYFYGTSTVTIRSNEQTRATINAALANALLVPSVDASLQKHYSAWKLTVKVGDNTALLASNENSTGNVYVKAGQSVTALFEGTNLLGNKTSKEWTAISATAACTQYTIQCNPDLSAFSNIQLTGTATHTTDASGYLNGTNVTLNLAANGAPIEAIESWDIKVLYNGTTIRTYSSNPNNATMEVVSGWPYVPQGSTLLASISLKSGDKIDLPSTTMATIPLPAFTATVSGSTSYSVYKSSGASAANAKDGSSIFDISSSVGISSDILNNPNYSDWLKVTYTTDGGGNSGELPYTTDDVTLIGLAWQKHVLIATASFDGAIATSASVDCDVTGLPYKPSAMVEADWSLASGNNKYDNGVIQLGGILGSQECTATSKMMFYIPNNIGVKLDTNVTVRDYQFIGWFRTTFTVSVNGSTIITQGGAKNTSGTNYDLSGVGTFVSGTCEIKLNSSYEAAGPWCKVYTLHILYN